MALPSCYAASPITSNISASAQKLLQLIPIMESGAPATNATLPLQVWQQIEAHAAALEKTFSASDQAQARTLNGSWRLLYSNGPEIVNLAELPFGFGLGPTYQPIDLATGCFENQGSLVNKFGIARLSTNVIGDVSVAPLGSMNSVGVRNDAGNRVDVTFRRITFSLDELFGQPVHLQKILVPNLTENATQPANDITYLDDDVRLTRGGDGALFIFRREDSSKPMLTLNERGLLYSAKGTAVKTGTGVSEDSAPPELKRLLRK